MKKLKFALKSQKKLKSFFNLIGGFNKFAASGDLYVREYFEKVISKSGRKDIELPKGNLDQIWYRYANKVWSPFWSVLPSDLKPDFCMDALIETVTEKAVKAYRGKTDNEFIAYFAGNFQNRLIDKIRKRLRSQNAEIQVDDSDGLTQDKKLDYLAQKNEYDPKSFTDPQTLVGWRDFLKQVQRLIRKKFQTPDSKAYASSVWELIQEGFTGREISKKLEISPSRVSQIVKEITSTLQRVAKDLGFIMIETYLKNLPKSKRSAEVIYASDEDDIRGLRAFIKDVERSGFRFDLKAGSSPDVENLEAVISSEVETKDNLSVDDTANLTCILRSSRTNLYSEDIFLQKLEQARSSLSQLQQELDDLNQAVLDADVVIETPQKVKMLTKYE